MLLHSAHSALLLSPFRALTLRILRFYSVHSAPFTLCIPRVFTMRIPRSFPQRIPRLSLCAFRDFHSAHSAFSLRVFCAFTLCAFPLFILHVQHFSLCADNALHLTHFTLFHSEHSALFTLRTPCYFTLLIPRFSAWRFPCWFTLRIQRSPTRYITRVFTLCFRQFSLCAFRAFTLRIPILYSMSSVLFTQHIACFFSLRFRALL